jgi:hypothetical protein
MFAMRWATIWEKVARSVYAPSKGAVKKVKVNVADRAFWAEMKRAGGQTLAVRRCSQEAPGRLGT